jgi:transposase InsO family protein
MPFGLGKICRVFGYTRQGYYKRKKHELFNAFQNEEVLCTVKEFRKRQPMVGVRKLQKMLLSEGITIGRDRLFDLLREHELLIYPKRNYRRTTNSKHNFRMYRNLIKDLELTGSNQVFVSDITYIRTLEGFCYLSLITDKFSRKIVGYNLSRSLAVEGSLRALKMAMRGVKRPENLIHHSDRGIQYCSNLYVDYLICKKTSISMTEKDHVYENALAERVNGILKNELMLGTMIKSFSIAKNLVKQSIEIYNNERLHFALNYKTPELVHAA